MVFAVQRESRPARLTALGVELDLSPASFGELRDSSDMLDDVTALRERMAREGYLYLPGYFDRAAVLAARRGVTDRLAAEGLTDPGYPADEAVAPVGSGLAFKPDLAHDNEPLHDLLYGERMIGFYEHFLGGAVRHYDFTWMRAVAPGRATPPHGDVVFMGRGTHDLYTAWVPLGDVDYTLGGLMILEGSNNLSSIRDDYARRDVDAYCENRPEERERALAGAWTWNGALSDDPARLREQLGGRWLTTTFRAGDLLTFSAYTIHGSLDNRGDRIRLSSDSRYQLASAPIDERWIGEAPIGNGVGGKRGLIC
jgi:hypothetical protein